ncbi:hypothetical protein ACIQRS_19685 [Streptomyces termitum]|uniref:Uncharacterized protein n=1 Tax=Streptomyces termitum TaxID=67368 RepID=A0A918T782_9ACTN|nr:hypothetical protein [Streptomyces termitum]GHB05196.1 hypothetical protein GCM10010305_55500 [Streptomyces termitum]
MRDETEQIQQIECVEQTNQVLPDVGVFVIDTRFSGARAGRVTAHEAGTVRLVPPGGGGWWHAPGDGLRPPTPEEWERIRVLSTPVRPLRLDGDAHQLRPDPGPVVLTAGTDADPAPAEGCTPCALLARRRAELREGPSPDWSAATDCSVEIRNHPHTPPKLPHP